MINELFAGFFESVLISDADYSNYSLVFNHLYDNGMYTYLGLITFLVILLPLFYFYKLYKNPYAGIIHWLITLLIGALLTAVLIYGILDWAIYNVHNPVLMDAISNTNTGYNDFIDSWMLIFPFKCAVIAFIWGAIISIVLKSISKIQTHIPI